MHIARAAYRRCVVAETNGPAKPIPKKALLWVIVYQEISKTADSKTPALGDPLNGSPGFNFRAIEFV